MLNINCIVCTDTFTQTDEVFTTRCGHLFHKTCIYSWLQRSETCPQCRNHCIQATVHKVYFNIDNSTNIDSGTVNELLDSANHQIKESERFRKKADDRISLLNQKQYDLMEAIADLKDTLQEKEGTILSYNQEVKFLKKEVQTSKNRIANLQEDLRRQNALRTTRDEQIHRLDTMVNELQCKLETSDNMRLCIANILETLKLNFSQLKWLVNRKARAAGWMFVWAKDGRILARKHELSNVVHIANASDLCKIV